MAENPKQTLDQRRAKHAWEAIISFRKNGKKEYGDDVKDYAREAKKLPVRIQSAGLGQALAFIKAKTKNKKLEQLNKDLSQWVIQERPIPGKVKEDLLESIILGDSDFLRRATDEALAYLQWLNRFAEAEGLTDDEGGNKS